ncbi:response regulator transcription factor [Luteimonas fraxinea]|uniref:Response regulator transcription factor n=1 Tax=Luteimonas fraxinea TaxID=2901869 RepID=A0ABS8UH45_9GAMM|nr:response regulator transcription factor [Luteimonas fraxinea]MCD9098056.1 response regulator transcription factor [Luteimonas fraxinea]UHH09219.1 response regulator transcription factor [Luteimonas fraxinea]
MTQRIIIVDDDQSVREALIDFLASQGFSAWGAVDGRNLDAVLIEIVPDLVILDVMLPGENGVAICKRLVDQRIPVLMLSALGSTPDRVLGLEGGADDYIAKPFDPRELLARVRSVLRRDLRAAERDTKSHSTSDYRFGAWCFDVEEKVLLDPQGSELRLTLGELSLLTAFVRNPNKLLSRSRLQDLVQGPGSESFDRAVDLAVSRLRRKLAERDEAVIIETVRGEGYRFRPSVSRP